MTRINRIQRLASLRPSTVISSTSRTPFVASRSISSTPCRRADDTLAQGEPVDFETAAERAASLRLPPKQSIADTEAEIAAADPSYTPATTLADLEPLPQLKNWWNQPGHWGSESTFSGFGVGAKEKITDPNLVKVMLRRAVLEVQALQQAGQYDALKFKRWALGGQEDLERVLASGVTTDESAAVVASLAAPETPEQHSAPAALTLAEAEAAVKSWGSDWMSMTLNDESKFVIRKRLYQLTGTLIPDARLAAAKTVRDIATLASITPKPKKLYHTLRSEANSFPPNVKIHSRRVTPIDREKAVGRWKVIEEELKKRDLPVTGTGDLASHREKVWITGKR